MTRPLNSDTLDRLTSPAGPCVHPAEDSARPAAPSADDERMPTLIGFAAVVEFARTIGVPAMATRYVKAVTEARELPSFRVANKLCYSPADVREWILTLRRDATTEVHPHGNSRRG